MPAVHGRVCYHPCETQLQPRPARRAGLHPRGRALSRRQGARRGVDADDHRGAHRQAHPDRRRRSERPVVRASSGADGPRRRDPRGRPDRRRHDALRHSLLPAAARRARRRDRAASSGWASRSSSITRSRTSSPRRSKGKFDAVFVAVGAHLVEEDRHPRPRRRQDPRRGQLPQGRRDGQRAQARPPGRHLRRRQHGDGRRPRRHAPRPRADDHLSPRPRAHAGARVRGRRGARGRRQDPLAAHHQVDRRDHLHRRGHGDRREGPAAADRTARDAGGRRPDPRPRSGHRHRRSCARSPASSSRTTAR